MTLHTRDLGNSDLVARGQCAYHAGRAAEDQVAAHYTDRGYDLLAERWRATTGEIDLILCAPDGCVVFVEVKKSKTFDQALRLLSPAQARRLFATAERYLDGLPEGLFTPSRLDVAVLNAAGEIRIMENFFAGGL